MENTGHQPLLTSSLFLMKQAKEFNPNSYEDKQSLLVDYKLKVREMMIDARTFYIMNPGMKQIVPPNYAILALRMYFAMIMPDQYLDFNLNWLNYSADYNDSVPTITKYLSDHQKIENYTKAVILDPEQALSSRKIKTVRAYFNKNKQHFDELIKQQKLWENYVCILSFSILTLKVLERVKGGFEKMKTIMVDNDMEKTLRDARNEKDNGEVARNKYHKKDLMRS